MEQYTCISTSDPQHTGSDPEPVEKALTTGLEHQQLT